MEPLPSAGHSYLTTEGKEIHALHVGASGEAPRAEQLTGNVGTRPAGNELYATGFGAQRMADYLKKNLRVNRDGVIEMRMEDLAVHLQEGFRQVSEYALELSGRPANFVSASWQGLDLGVYLSNFFIFLNIL